MGQDNVLQASAPIRPRRKVWHEPNICGVKPQ
jgi:hypothetical protein